MPLISRYGRDIAIPVLFLSAVIFAGAWFITSIPLRIFFLLLGGVIFLFTFWFFRDPERSTQAGDELVICPADGKVIAVYEVEENEYLQGRARQISIFMSPLDVHVNRLPVSGMVEYVRHVRGAFTVAFADKSSDVNERTLVGISCTHGKVLTKQIAGFIARRIVCPLRRGDIARAGERFGMIRFGSRVDLLLPPIADVAVTPGQRVRAGETVVARFRRGDSPGEEHHSTG
ncbi:MAG: phosphatidylserine decarboxylase family protein [Bacteroidota bacterium]|nr:phosphatidylserine decarboxylase family protein [Bacteroidota bacterium]